MKTTRHSHTLYKHSQNTPPPHHQRTILGDTLPRYVGGPYTVSESSVYDLFFTSYDSPYVINAIASILGIDAEDVEAVGWRDEWGTEEYVDTTTCWSETVGELWPCEGEELKK